MLILRLLCENSPRIIAASCADPAVLKNGVPGSRLPIFTQFIHKFYYIVEHPLDPPVCIYMHPFLMYT